jgi:hypothetical protein
MSKPTYLIPQPQRVRCITRSFAWIDHRLLRSGFVQVMTHQDQSLYLFLNLAADRNGVSFYRKEKICDLLDLDFGQFEVARDRLIHLGLLAFAPYSALTVNGFHQVLPVDGRPVDFAAARPVAPIRPCTPDAATDPPSPGPAPANCCDPAPAAANARAAKLAANELAAAKLAAAFKAGLSRA